MPLEGVGQAGSAVKLRLGAAERAAREFSRADCTVCSHQSCSWSCRAQQEPRSMASLSCARVRLRNTRWSASPASLPRPCQKHAKRRTAHHTASLVFCRLPGRASAVGQAGLQGLRSRGLLRWRHDPALRETCDDGSFPSYTCLILPATPPLGQLPALCTCTALALGGIHNGRDGVPVPQLAAMACSHADGVGMRELGVLLLPWTCVQRCSGALCGVCQLFRRSPNGRDAQSNSAFGASSAARQSLCIRARSYP